MLKKWILATALAALPFAAVAKKPAKAKTAAVSSAKADAELEQIMGGFSESEKAGLRTYFISNLQKNLAHDKNISMFLENNSWITVFIYNDEDVNQVLNFLKEYDSRTKFSAIAVTMLDKMYGECDNDKKIDFALLNLIDITSISVRIADKDGKTLGEASMPMPDCAVTQQ